MGLSVIIPVYNESDIIDQACCVVSNVLTKASIDFEIIFVDDGSTDVSWNKILQLSKYHSNVSGISFSRNFGKESAIYAGLAECKGDCAVVMDCDLQHPPEKIVEMYDYWLQGYEIVEGYKKERGKESKIYSALAYVFYKVISKTVNVDMSNASDFKLLDRKVVTTLLNIPERKAFFRALSSWVGYKTIYVEYSVRERVGGVSKWNWISLVKYAISNISAFTSAPLHIVTVLGILMFFLGVVLTVFTVYQKFKGISQEGFTTVIILQCLSGSIIMISLGIIGYYISQMYDEIKHRPKYIIRRRTNEGEE